MILAYFGVNDDMDNNWAMLKTPCIQQISNKVFSFLLWIQVSLALPINLSKMLLGFFLHLLPTENSCLHYLF